MSALQVKNASGHWVAATPIPGTFVVNVRALITCPREASWVRACSHTLATQVGDMFKVWTNGLYQPTLHRVVLTGDRSRVSLPFFYEPSFHARVAPIPQLVGSEGPRFQPVVYGDHLLQKVRGNFEL